MMMRLYIRTLTILTGLIIAQACGVPDSNELYHGSSDKITLEGIIEQITETPSEDIISQAHSIFSGLEETPFISEIDRKTLLAIAITLIRSYQTDEAIEILSLTRNYSSLYNDLSLLAEVNERLGRIYQSRLQFEVADFYLAEAFEIYLEINEKNRLGEVSASRAYNMLQRGLYVEANNVLDQAYALYGDSGDYSKLAAIEGTKSIIFNRIDNEERSFYYAYRAIHNAQAAQDDQRLMGLYGNMGVLFRNINADSSLYYYGKAKKMANEMDDEVALLRSNINILNIYTDQGDFEKATVLIPQLERESIRLQNQQGILLVRFAMAKLQALTGEFDLSDALLKEVIEEMEAQSMRMLKASSMREMSEIYDSMGESERVNLLTLELEALESAIYEDEMRLKLSQASLLQNIQEIDSERAVLKSEILKKELITKFWIALAILLIIAIVYGAYSYLKNMRRLQLEKIKQIEKIKLRARGQKSAELKNVLKHCMETDKLFINQDLKVEDLCDIAGVNRSTLIQSIHAGGWAGFNEYVNSYRVEEMKRLLLDPDKQNYSLDHLHREAGFGSKQSFYKNFRKIAGTSPAKWRAKNRSRTIIN